MELTTFLKEGKLNQELSKQCQECLKKSENLTPELVELLKMIGQTYEEHQVLLTNLTQQVEDKEKRINELLISDESKNTDNKNLSDKMIFRIRSLEQIIHIISHNFRSPIANISSLCGLIVKISDPSKKDFGISLKAIEISVNKLGAVIVDLDKIVEANEETEKAREKVRLSDLISDIKISINYLIMKEKVTIKTDFSLEELDSIKSYLHSIFYNLILNSIKYKKKEIDPIIEISCHAYDDKTIILFKDNGLGFNLAKNGREIFGPYKKFHGDTEGKGLGLYMVRTHIETLGGQIELKSEVNKGAEFSILLPLK